MTTPAFATMIDRSEESHLPAALASLRRFERIDEIAPRAGGR